MDALAPELVPRHEGLRAAMERRRDDRSAPQRILMRLLGMDMKMRQYRQGKAFCDAVAAEGGTALLNRVWESPAALPTGDELRRPERWITRVAG
jgi:putative hydrolase